MYRGAAALLPAAMAASNAALSPANAGTVRLKTPEDYAALLPDTLPEAFTARELSKALGLPQSQGSAAANVLVHMGVIRQTGTRGRAFVYTIVKEE